MAACPRTGAKTPACLQPSHLTRGLCGHDPDSAAFEVYIKQVLCPQLREGQVVILDRLNVHKNQRVREAIEAKGSTLQFLLIYSPDLDPIELAFSKLKTWVRRVAARTRQALDDAIAAALKTVTLQDVIGWFAHAGCQHHSF